MSRVTKWKLEKAKVKVVFRLQFHATHIPASGWEKLFISFIPTESGKITAKTSKANVRNGSCKWADPIYETTRLLLDSKSNQYDDKLYKLVVGMGTSRSTILGEATINLADYADAAKPSTLALPLHGSDHGTILHVTVQLLTAKTGFREFEQQRDRGLQRGGNLNRENEPSTAKLSSSELQSDDQVNKDNTRTQLREESKELPSVVKEMGIAEECSSNASESYADKHDSSSTHELDSLKSTVSGDLNGQLHSQSQLQGWSSDYSMDNDLAIAYEENHRLKASLDMAESNASELKLELSALQNHSNEMSIETEKFAQQLKNEIASSQELAKEVIELKSECSRFKNDLEQLKEMKSSSKFIEKMDQNEALGVNIYEPETILQFGNIPSGSTRGVDLIEVENFELLSQLDKAKAERESLVAKMDQMECYYEGLVQELEENQKRILVEFQSLRNEHSTCAYTISTCKAETESIRHDLNEQILKLAEERRDLRSVNEELERRATTSESALKRARLNYSIAVSQLQKDLDTLSFQVLTMFETNQELIKDAFSETSVPFNKGYPDLSDDFVKSDDTLVPRIQSKHLSSGDVLSDDMKKSLNFQENLYQKVEGELCEMCCANLYLDVYSGTLEETLYEARTDIRKSKEELDSLAQTLKLSNESRDILFVRLQSVMEEVHALNRQNACCLAKINEVELHNQMLEENLRSVSNENFLLMEKITECEALLMDYEVYKRKYDAASAKKMELEKLLEVQVLDNGDLRKELETLKDGFGELAMSNENMQKVIDFLQEKLHSLLASYNKQFDGHLPFSASLCRDVDFKDYEQVFMRLEEVQKIMSQKTSHLVEQKKDLEKEIDDMKRKFKRDIHDIVVKLDLSNASVEKLQLRLESIANKFKSTFESEERNVEQSEMLLTYLASLELELQNISSNDKNFVQQIMGLDTMVDDFERSKLTISELKQENQDLMVSLRNKTEESTELLSEFDLLKERLRCTNGELDEERGLKVKLEDTVASLTSELNGERDKLRHFDGQSSELVHFRRLAVDRELENSRVLELLEESLRKEQSSVSSLDSQLAELQEILICEEVELIFVKTHYQTQIEELVNQHAVEVGQLKDMLTKSESKIGQYVELQSKLHDSEARLKHCLDSEARYLEENGKLATTLESLRSELEASIAQNTNIIELNSVLTVDLKQFKDRFRKIEVDMSEEHNQHAAEVQQLKDLLMKSEVEAERSMALESKLLDTETRLNQCLESEERYIKENRKLATTLESLKSELEASFAQIAVTTELNNALMVELEQFKDKFVKIEVDMSEEHNKHAAEVRQLKDSATNSELEADRCRELESKLLDTEMRLNQCLEREERHIKENGKLATTIESLKSELEASFAQIAVSMELNNALMVELEQFKDKFVKIEVDMSEEHNKHAAEVRQLKDLVTKSELEADRCRELESKLLDTEMRLSQCLRSEERYIEENGKLSTTLESLRSELEASFAQIAAIMELNNALTVELEQFKDRFVKIEVVMSEEHDKHAAEVQKLKDLLARSKVEAAECRELELKLHDTEARLNQCLESEAQCIEENEKSMKTIESLRSELDASIAQIAVIKESINVPTVDFDEYKDTVSEVDSLIVSKEESEIIGIVLKAKFDEYNEELIVLRNKCCELTNKLSEQILKTEEFKNLSIYLKELKDTAEVAREKREPEGPSESLRIAFIKEQYETKIQELKQQLSVSKRHGEEMLFKLQDALNETESRKKSEASHLKRIEELETELQLMISEKPDYDRIQAELECALLSLECCKEEKEKLGALLQECEYEKSKFETEISLIREELAAKDENGARDKQRRVGSNGSMDDKLVQNVRSMPIKGVSETEGVNGVPKDASPEEENPLLNNSKQLTIVDDKFRAQHLMSCMEQLGEELEKMKNESNSLVPFANSDPTLQDLQRELVQLQKANKELGTIYPNFNDFPGNGNALERVLALEIELAESLRAKKRSSIQFQSSFLKQHSDEEAVFKSFRDINELIKDMLEIKGKYVNVETELKEMHDRYSQLSLQFAEVEGERQKLMMTLKNVRSSRNMLRLNRSSSTTLEENPL